MSAATWEAKKTKEGRQFWINHATQETKWEIPEHSLKITEELRAAAHEAWPGVLVSMRPDVAGFKVVRELKMITYFAPEEESFEMYVREAMFESGVPKVDTRLEKYNAGVEEMKKKAKNFGANAIVCLTPTLHAIGGKHGRWYFSGMAVLVTLL